MSDLVLHDRPPTLEIDELFAGAQRLTLSVGEHLFGQGDRVSGFHRLVSGTVVLKRPQRDGRLTPLQRFTASAIIAEASLFAEAYRCDCVCEQDAVIHRIDRSLALARLKTAPSLAITLLRQSNAKLQHTRALLELRDIRKADGRCRAHLELIAHNQVVSLDRPLRRFAAEIGLTEEAYYRALKRLTDRGLIRRTSTSIHLIPEGN